ncbi:MAG TPA: NUDIX domain-containing protein [Methylocystis sp.]|nr:NUDIX domain-containing protein [Methylocystis sp.]
MTLGVRGLVVDAGGRVFLVRHTYIQGWFLPGGGVERGETLEQSLARELVEEGNIEILGTPLLHGVYLNRATSPRDHVALYVVRDFRQIAPHTPDNEIAESGFFAPDALPLGATRSTRARIAEALAGAPLSAYW